MVTKGTKLPKATIVRILKEAGAERVSSDAADAVNQIVSAVAKGAVKSAKASKRKTVSAADLKLVVVT